MKQVLILIILLLLAAGGPALATQPNRGFLGDVDGYLILTTENDMNDSDQPVVKSEFSLWRDTQIGGVAVEPFYYLKNETNPNSVNNAQVTENMLGLNLVVQQTDAAKITAGLGYKYRYKNFGDNNDSLMLSQFRMDF